MSQRIERGQKIHPRLARDSFALGPSWSALAVLLLDLDIPNADAILFRCIQVTISLNRIDVLGTKIVYVVILITDSSMGVASEQTGLTFEST